MGLCPLRLKNICTYGKVQLSLLLLCPVLLNYYWNNSNVFLKHYSAYGNLLWQSTDLLIMLSPAPSVPVLGIK